MSLPGPGLRSLPRGQLLAAAALLPLFVAYPFAASAALEQFATRPLALVLAALAAWPLIGAARRRAPLGTAPAAGIVTLAVVAAGLDDPRPLRLVPAWIYAVLAHAFARSLRGEDSILERAARFLEPAAPGFIRSYCRTLTALWSAWLLANAVVLAGLALAAPPAWWRAYSGYIAYALMAGLALVEFLFRKSWFRYYWYGGPFDRFWAALFPPEKTERGRRSQAYIRRMREQARDAALPE